MIHDIRYNNTYILNYFLLLLKKYKLNFLLKDFYINCLKYIKGLKLIIKRRNRYNNHI